MKNRLLTSIRKAQHKESKLFCAYLTLGYPNMDTTQRLIHAFQAEGVDMIELGFPFSDPLADGPTIQHASELALKRGVRLKDAFSMARRIRQAGNEIPLIFFGYFNPIFHYGCRRFAQEAKRAGFDALIVPDLPPDSERTFRKDCRHVGLLQIFLIAPTTSNKRAGMIANASSGFIYYVSVRGVTGVRHSLPRDIGRHLREIKKRIRQPILIGFGVSTPEQAKALSRFSSGVIVGSALIDQIRLSHGKISRVIGLVRRMVRALKKKNPPYPC
ncbi:MAG: tryptophan synthase subunit alpha [Candidatus Omnitrophica bacterium]|nr:tryptophan synthase subunit alpha [Candidatus Omnitrophota bacterium]